MAKSIRRQLEELLESLQPEIRSAFLAAIQDIRNNVDLQRLYDRIAAGDIIGAMEAINLDGASFNAWADSLENTYMRSGIAALRTLPRLPDEDANRVVVRFDGRNVRAEQWLKQRSSYAITSVLADQREAIRSALTAGMERGENPRMVALDIVGRYNSTSKKREGGIIGLTSQQERFVRNYQAELMSADPEVLSGALARARRDKRFDSVVKRAMEKGEPIPRETAARMVQRYKDSLLQLRGETIARTEALTSLNAAQAEAMNQAIEAGKIKSEQAFFIWRSASDARVRDTHAAMEGQKRRHGLEFESPSGARLRYPGDPLAPAGEIINCRCILEPAIDFLAGVK